MTSHTRSFAIILCLFYLSELCVAQFSHVTVKMTNDLGLNLELIVHCKSKNDDLGPQYLQPGQSYEFGFKPNLFGSTRFFCRFHWTPNDEHWFDIYEHGNKPTSDCKHCFWSVTPSGPCRLDADVGGYVCFPWNKN